MDTVSGPIDWAIASQAPDVVDAANKGALTGYELGQKGAVLHALQGVDFSNPDSMNTAIQGLVHAGASDQANALIGLDRTRLMYDQAKNIFRRNGVTPPQVPAAAAPSPAPNAAATPAPALGPDGQPAPPPVPTSANTTPATVSLNGRDVDQASAAAHMAKIEQAVDQVSAFPYPQRKAAIAQAGPALGFTPDQINAFDPTDENIAGLKSQIQAHHDYIGGNVSDDIYTPQDAEAFALMSGDPKAMTDAYRLANPDYLPVQGLPGVVYNPRTNRTQRIALPSEIAGQAGLTKQAEATAQHQVDIAFAKPDAWAAALKAGAVASAEEAAKAPYDFMPVTRPDGTVGQVRKDFAVSYAGQHGGLLNQGPSTSEAAYLAAQGPQAAKLLEPDEPGRQQAQNAEATAQRALATINGVKTDNLTPLNAETAGWLRTFGVGGKDADHFANDAASYKSISNEALTQGAHATFPGRITNSDLTLFHTITPGLTTPNDAARTYFGIQQAVAQRKQEYEDWKSQYSGEHTPQAIENAWIHGPGAKSIFEYPAWQNITLGGQPAVQVKQYKGHNITVFGLGTGHPVYIQQ